MFKQIIKKSLDRMDDTLVALDGQGPAGGHLIGVLFHSLLEDASQLRHPDLAPGNEVTQAQFRAFVQEMLELGYTVVSPAQIRAGLNPGGKYLAITFDDGYFNNTLALEVLQEFRVPATFFISTENVEANKSFWWDAYGRELARRGLAGTAALSALAAPKRWQPGRIDTFLEQAYGADCLLPRGDVDRPFTPAELREFALSPWVHIGNHTLSHAILTRCTAQEVLREIVGCQQALERLVGYRPLVIAYPNGNYSRSVTALAREAGLELGFTVVRRRNALPLDPLARMEIGRFSFDGSCEVRAQCRKFAARFVPSYLLRRLLQGPDTPLLAGLLRG